MARPRLPSKTKKILGVLDIGTTKIVCLVATVDGRSRSSGESAMRIAGVGHHRAHGIKAGVITDLAEAQYAASAAIANAERMAGVHLDKLVVGIACGRLRSHNFAAGCETATGVVGVDDVGRVFGGAREFVEGDGRRLVHMNRIGFRLDGEAGGQNPIGMAAQKLTADVHCVTADEGPLRNLEHVLDHCYMSVERMVPTAYASALAATTLEERRLGVTCLDIGGGTTTLSVFAEGHFLASDCLPVGGGHITFDIARKLQTPLAEAERIKALYGTVVKARSDEHEVFSCPVAGGDLGEVYQTTKAQLADVIRPRVEDMLSLVGKKLDEGGLRRLAGSRLVITGGCGQLVGLAELAAARFGSAVRIGRPREVSGLPPALSTPAYSTAVGLLDAGREDDALDQVPVRQTPAPGGYFRSVGQWLREGF